MNRYETVLRWFKEYGFTIVKRNESSAYWHETKMKDRDGKTRVFEITNNNIWYMKNGRTSFGKTKTELFYNFFIHLFTLLYFISFILINLTESVFNLKIIFSLIIFLALFIPIIYP